MPIRNADEFVTLGGFAGGTRVRRAALEVEERQLANRRRIQSQRFGPNQNLAAGAIENLLGLPGSTPTGNAQVVRGQTAGDVAARFGGDIAQTLSQDEQSTLEQFFNPTLTQEQQFDLERRAALAQGQGIMGNVVRSQLSDLATTQIAGNRASSFGTVQGLVGRGTAALQQNVAGAFSQLGNLGVLGISGRGGVRNLLLAQGQGQQQLQQFATPLLRALNAFGLGGDAISGLAQSRGVSFQQAGGTQGNRTISNAFADFINPTGTAVEEFARVQAGRNAGVGRNAFSARERAFRAANRFGAAEVLGQELRGRLDQVVQGASSLSATGAGARAFQQFGDLGSAQRVAGLDTSQFAPLLQSLGITPRQRGAAAQLQRGSFLPQSSVLRNVIGL